MTNIQTRTVIGLLIITAGLMTAATRLYRPASLCRNLTCIRMDGTGPLALHETYTDTPDVFRGLFTGEGRFLRIEANRTAPESSRQDLNAAITKMKAMFEKAPAPYPGELSDTIVCDPRFVPTYETLQRNGTDIHIFVGYLNDRMTFGSCSREQATYRGALALLFCKNRSLLLRVELIAPVADFSAHEKELTDQIRSLQCGD